MTGDTRPVALTVTVAGEPLLALPDRALVWPRQRTLIVADVHLGKGAAFRRAGVPVPSGSTAADLARLDALIAAHAPERLLVLGDLFHAALHADEPALAAVDAFRSRHPALAVVAIRGNHDRAVERLPATWRIDWVIGSRHEAPFVFAHEPGSDPRGVVLAGHIHPVLKLQSRRDRARLPIYWFRHAERIVVLPSFGSFTGGWPVAPARTDTVIAVTPDGLVPIQSGSPLSDLSPVPSCTS